MSIHSKAKPISASTTVNRVTKAAPISSKGELIIHAETGYLRLSSVLKLYPVSRTTWYDGIKQGIYPAPVQLGRRSVGWSTESIRALIENPPKF